MSLETWEKQPRDQKDYDIFFTDWLPQGDTLADATATVECTTTPANTSLEAFQVDLSDTIVKVWLRGGTDGERYKVTVLATTNSIPPRKDEVELTIIVKDT